MNNPKYTLKASSSLAVFSFTSVGPKGDIPKIIVFSATDKPNVVNLGFGDIDKETGNVDDKVVSDNGDRDKVLATVVEALYIFTEKYPGFWVYAVGSNKIRTRLYQIGITNHWELVEKDFEVYGLLKGNWDPFKKNVNYEAFMVKRKK